MLRVGLAAGGGEQRVERVAEQLLLGAGQFLHLLELLMDFSGRPAFAGFRMAVDQLFDTDPQGLGNDGQHRDLNTPPHSLEGGDGLLRDAQGLRELHLVDAVLFCYSNFNRAEHACKNERVPDFLHGLSGLLAHK